MEKKESLYRLLELLALLSIITLPFIFFADFHTRGEGREALNTVSACQGEWLWPKGFDGNRSSKPPFFYWLVCALSGSEIKEYSVRLPSYIFSVLVLSIFYLVVSNQISSNVARIMGFMLLTSPIFISNSQIARLDMVHSASLAVSWILLIYEKAFFIFISGFFLGISTLSKGPVALVLTAILTIFYYLLTRDRKISTRLLIAACLGLLIAAPWYIAAYLKYKKLILDVIWRENVDRFLSSQAPHRNSILKFLTLFLLGLGPVILVNLFTVIKDLLREFKFVTISLENLLANLRQRKEIGYLLLCSITPILFYSLSSGKRPAYALSSVPFICLLSALLASKQNRYQKLIYARSFIWLTRIVLIAAFLGVLGGAVYMYPMIRDNPNLRLLFLFAFLGSLMVLFVFLKQKRILEANPFSGFFRSSIIVTLCAIFVIHTLLGTLWSKTASHKKLANWLIQINTDNLPVLGYRYQFYALQFYLKNKFVSNTSYLKPPYLLIMPDKLKEQFVKENPAAAKLFPPLATYNGFVDKLSIRPIVLKVS